MKRTQQEQKVEALTPEDLSGLDRQRDWVRDHFEETSRHLYEEWPHKLSLIAGILEDKLVKPDETWKLQSLGTVFGDALALYMKLDWVILEDRYGRSPGLRVPGTTIVVFPVTAISKRIERGEIVDVFRLFKDFCKSLEERKPFYRVN